MLLVLSSKDANTSVYNYSIVEAPAGASVASDGYGNCLMDFSACGLSASNLNIGDIRIKAVLYGGEEATITVKGVKAKATKPTVRIAPMKVFKEVTATVKASTNAVCTYKTADGHIHAIEPEKYVAAAAKGADIQQNPMSESEFLTYNMSKNSGSVKVTLTFAGGLQKTVTVKGRRPDLKLRYAPYTKTKERLAKLFLR